MSEEKPDPVIVRDAYPLLGSEGDILQHVPAVLRSRYAKSATFANLIPYSRQAMRPPYNSEMSAASSGRTAVRGTCAASFAASSVLPLACRTAACTASAEGERAFGGKCRFS